MENALDYISITGFRSIRAIEKLALRPINILVGANGTGKSNFVEVFAFLNAIRRGRLQNYTQQKGGANKILHFGAKTTSELTIELSFKNGVNGYSITLNPSETDKLYPQKEMVWFWDRDKYHSPYYEQLTSSNNEAGISRVQKRTSKRVQQYLDSWRIYHFHDTGEQSPMKRTADIYDNQFFRPDGENLPAYLLFLKERYPTNYRLIRNIVQRVAPFLDDFQLRRDGLNPDKIRLEWIHKSSDQYFDVSSLSDGTLRFICLATLLLQPIDQRPSIILLDEPELGLHPSAIAMLANMVKSAAKQTQVIISTQSALLLDHFQPEDILVAELQDGATTLKRLDPTELDGWLNDYSYSLGQLWEKNEFGGRP